MSTNWQSTLLVLSICQHFLAFSPLLVLGSTSSHGSSGYSNEPTSGLGWRTWPCARTGPEVVQMPLFMELRTLLSIERVCKREDAFKLIVTRTKAYSNTYFKLLAVIAVFCGRIIVCASNDFSWKYSDLFRRMEVEVVNALRDENKMIKLIRRKYWEQIIVPWRRVQGKTRRNVRLIRWTCTTNCPLSCTKNQAARYFQETWCSRTLCSGSEWASRRD